jgi:ubiquitin-protein ligase E3 C
VTRTVALKAGGNSIPVTRANRLEYIYLVAHHRLTRQIQKQSTAFFEGLSELIEPRWLRMFNQQELQVLVGGAEEPIDVDDLKRNVVYGGLYDEDHETIRIFWRVVKSMDENSRRLLLRFVTSCARPPLL